MRQVTVFETVEELMAAAREKTLPAALIVECTSGGFIRLVGSATHEARGIGTADFVDALARECGFAGATTVNVSVLARRGFPGDMPIGIG